MAMFEIKDSKNITLDSNQTSSEKLLLAENVAGLEAKNNSTGIRHAALAPISKLKRFGNWVCLNSTAVIVGIIGGAIGTLVAQAITARLQLPH